MAGQKTKQFNSRLDMETYEACQAVAKRRACSVAAVIRGALHADLLHAWCRCKDTNPELPWPAFVRGALVLHLHREQYGEDMPVVHLPAEQKQQKQQKQLTANLAKLEKMQAEYRAKIDNLSKTMQRVTDLQDEIEQQAADMRLLTKYAVFNDEASEREQRKTIPPDDEGD